MGNDNAIFVQVGLGLLVIFFFVMIGFSVRTWRFAHLFFLVLSFGGALFFTVFAAMVLKTHMVWRVEAKKLADDLETQTKAIENIQHGEITLAPDKQEANLRSVKAERGRILFDRGRVWHNCQAGNFDGTSVQVTTAAPPGPVPEGQAAPTPKPNGIEVRAILYAFKERPDANQTMLLPGEYLGEFVATAVTESTVSLSPTIPPDAEQLQQLQANDTTWVLYEVLPIDGHQFFADLSEEQLRALLPQGKLPAEAYEAMIASYMRTGKPATDDDPPEHRWWKVTFLKAKSIDVDSDLMGVTTPDYFDQQGRSVAARLRRGEKVEFDLGDTALLDETTADLWAAAGEVKKDQAIYMRPLNDYAKMFHFFFLEREELADKIELVTRETASIVEATTLAEAQVARLTDENGKLEQDKTNFTAEQQEVAKLEQALLAQSEELRKQLSATFLLNQQLAAELALLQKQLADEVAKADASKTAALTK